MRLAIVGPRLSGKTTLFNALTGLDAATGVGAEGAVNIGVFNVPDPLFDRLVELDPHPKVTHARVEMVDIPGFLDVPASGGGVRGLDEKILHHARTAEALVLVVRAFERPSVPLPGGELDPVADLNAAWTDMVVADLGSAEKRLEKLKSLATKGGASDEEKVELEALQRVAPHLEEGGGVAGLEFSGEEERLLRGFGFLTLKPLIVVVNTGEEALPASVAPEWASWGEEHDAGVLALCADLASELVRMEPDEAEEFAAEYGVALDAAEEVIQEAYRALDVVTFYTAVGDKEARAWTIPCGGTALDAAAAVHTDMARGFIRAEVINVQVLLESGTWTEARKSGLLRQEGKGYLVEDGDVINIKFAV